VNAVFLFQLGSSADLEFKAGLDAAINFKTVTECSSCFEKKALKSFELS